MADADSRSIVPTITNSKARELATNLPAQRQQEKARAKAATAAESRKKSKYSRSEFKDLVIGMTKDEVLSAVGKPMDTQELGDLEFWYYQNITYDPVTDKTDSRVQLGFESGRVGSVNAI